MRGRKIKTRKVIPDSVYQSQLVTKLINRVMVSGKKTIAQKHVYRALLAAQKKQGEEPLVILTGAIDNIKPRMIVRPRRIGGAAYQIPVSVSIGRQLSLAIRWLVEAARARPNKEYHTFTEKLTAELIDAFENAGGAVKKKENIHRMAEANKAFAHFKW